MTFSPVLVMAGLQLNFSTLPQQLVNGLLLGSIYALIALGYTMVYGVLRLINFAHGDVYMLGAYIALFVSYAFGFGGTPGAQVPPPSFMYLIAMLLASMIGCALIGVIIERFAYRPMRNHSRTASLITAIGVSLFLEYGGQLVLPVSPPPSINEKVSPFKNVDKNDVGNAAKSSGELTFILRPAPAELRGEAEQLKPAFESAKKEFQDYLTTSKEDKFNLSAKGTALRDKAQDTERKYQDIERRISSESMSIVIQFGQMIMFGTSLVLMAILSFLVMKTPAGRAMRAVSLDFDSASLMGINVDKIITWTFVLGSGLAGAGAMMTATFLGTPLTTFYGLAPGVKAFVAAVLGGIGNIPGAVLGGLLMGLAETLVVWLGYSSFKDAIAFVILIVILMFKPGGLLGSAKVEKV